VVHPRPESLHLHAWLLSDLYPLIVEGTNRLISKR
jgi:hypothetical protein